MKALITGARGFCGRHLAAGLKAGGHLVAGFDLEAGPLPHWVDDFAAGDIADSRSVASVVRLFEPDVVFHLAGLSRGTQEAMQSVNVAGTVNLLDAVRRESPQAGVIVVGSSAEYGHVPDAQLPVVETQPCRPVGPYGKTKYAATMTALDFASKWGLRVVVARPFNIVGAGVPETLVVGALVARIRKAANSGTHGIVPIGNLEARRDFLAVEDVVTAYIAMADVAAWNQVFNVCSGRARSVREVAEALCAFSRVPVTLRVEPDLVRHEEVPVMVGSGKKAQEWLGFVPTSSFESALRSAWQGWPSDGATVTACRS